MPVTPLSPAQVLDAQLGIPDAVLTAVNALLRERGGSGRAMTFTQEEVIARTDKSTLNLPPGIAFYMSWLDFEPLYRAQGWKVTYEKPARDEVWDAFFTFTPVA